MKTIRTLGLAALSLALAVNSHADVTGTIMTVEGFPLPKTEVRLYAPESGDELIARFASGEYSTTPLAAGQTDRYGKFRIETPKGTHVVEVEVSPTGYEPKRTRIADGEDTGTLAIRVASTVQGRVMNGDEGVEGATLVWVGRDGARFVVVTRNDGTYEVPNPAGWARQVNVFHPEFARIRESEFLSALRTDFHMSRGVEVKGVVVGEDGETPVAGARLEVDGWPAGVTGEDGSFEIDRLPEDWEVLTAETGTHIGAMNRGASNPKIRTSRSAVLNGTLLDARTNRPIAGADVTVGRGRFGERGGERTVTDESGRYRFDPILPGAYRVMVNHPSFSVDIINVTVRGGEKKERNISATATGTISGFVVDEAGQPVAAGVVKPAPRARGPFSFRGFGSNETAAWSAPDGSFVLHGVQPDTELDLELTKKGFPSTKEGVFELYPGEKQTGVMITVPSGVTVSGRVIDENDEPITEVEVVASPPAGGGFGGRRMMMIGGNDDTEVIETNADGEFEMQLEEGKYDFSFRRSGYATYRMKAVEVRSAGEPIEVVLGPGVELVGRVVRSDDTGVPDVSINVLADGDRRDPVTTAADGSFVIPDLSPGSIMVLASKPDDFIQEMKTAKVPGDELVIKLPATGRIEGRVVDKATGSPVQVFDAGPTGDSGAGGIQIRMATNPNSFHNEDGSFALENVPAGPTSVIVNSPGYLERTVRGLKVTEGETLSDVEIALEKGSQIVGRVTGPDGSPVAGVTVATETDEGDFPMPLPAFLRGGASGTTDAGGQYTLESVPPGEATVTFQKSGFLTERKSVVVTDEEARVDARLSKGKVVSGRVVTDAGQPVPDAEVRARSSVQDSGWNFATADAGGEFSFEGLTPGRYEFNAEKAGLVEAVLPDVDIETTPTVQLVMATGGRVRGRILGAKESDYSSITVIAQGVDGRSTAAVDSKGGFLIEGVAAGSVRVSASQRSLFSNRTAPEKVIDLAPGGEAVVDLEFSIDTVIEGRVTQDGKALEGALVNFVPRDRSIQTRGTTTTASNGRYEVIGLEDGEYDVSVINLESFSPYDTTYEVRGSGDFDIAIEGGVLRGRVTDRETGEPIADAVIKLENPNDGERRIRLIGAFEKMTNPSGGFEFTSIPAGTYQVRAEKKDFGHDIGEIRISEGGSETIELKLQRDDGARLEVVDARDGRSLSATVWLLDSQDRTVFEGRPTPREDGSVRIGVSPGQYRGVITASGYAPVTTTISAPSPVPMKIGMVPGGTILIRGSEEHVRTGRLISANGAPFVRSSRNRQGDFSVNPGSTRVENVTPGSYALQIIDVNGNVEESVPVMVQEGRVVEVDL